MRIAALLSRRWLPFTVLILMGAAVCVRLGIWQVDRLAQRRAANQHLATITSMPVLVLPALEDVSDQEYRAAAATGTYDFGRQVALRNQAHNGEYGYHLLTPFLSDGAPQDQSGSAILVDRGWIPAAGNEDSDAWRQYDLPGRQTVTGVIRFGRASGGTGAQAGAASADNGSSSSFALVVDTGQLSTTLGYPLAPYYLQATVEAEPISPPIPEVLILDRSEGSHLGYAIQWFGFAVALVVGYGAHVRKQVAITQ